MLKVRLADDLKVFESSQRISSISQSTRYTESTCLPLCNKPALMFVESRIRPVSRSPAVQRSRIKNNTNNDLSPLRMAGSGVCAVNFSAKSTYDLSIDSEFEFSVPWGGSYRPVGANF